MYFSVIPNNLKKMAAGRDVCAPKRAHDDDSKQNILPSASSLIVVKVGSRAALEPNTN